MKLIRLKGFDSSEFTSIFGTLTQDGKHYNVRHGNKSKNTWEIKLGIDDKMVKKELHEKQPVIELKENYYVLKPIYNKYSKEHVKDPKEYKKYYLSFDVDKDNDGVLLFINVPSINVKDLKYKYYGNCTVVSIGSDISIINNEIYTIDAPIILMNKWSKIEIEEVNKNNEKVIHILEYNGDLSLKKG